MSELTYTGLGVTRRYNPLVDEVATPELFSTPATKWVCAELHWTTGFESLIFESTDAAKARADALGCRFLNRMPGNKRK